jgi:hypothetical protein
LILKSRILPVTKYLAWENLADTNILKSIILGSEIRIGGAFFRRSPKAFKASGIFS